MPILLHQDRVASAQVEQPRVQRLDPRAWLNGGLAKWQFRAEKRRFRLWIGNPFSRRRVRELREGRKFCAPPLSHQRAELRRVVRKVLKRR